MKYLRPIIIMMKKTIYGSVQQKRATERARCLLRVKGALFNSLIIVCCVFEKKTKDIYLQIFSCSFQWCHCFYGETLSSGRKLELNIESHFSQSISCAFGGPFLLDTPICILSDDEALALFVDCKFTKNQYNTIRRTLNQKGVNVLPTYKHITEVKTR